MGTGKRYQEGYMYHELLKPGETMTAFAINNN